ncbi:Urea active transporter [Pyrenophora tritici-repentis]|uniref:Urea active transporter n=3 Tax=Pyrenophora tritici-repentis TaxID=45151 RepID=A0A2W1E4U5_9PLEO|nr:urea active transporter [Pyrenophora tritici-repentis Pt-1C-BFP]KAA8612656.1 Urea active transporter [Pyrenophora tritici-repentis]EDU47488.1 urea active transporter [Pyrenophora tritici-repentis Pt-1C-BFP]KAG9383118.1 Urea active transporter [Pyrenophora tritici-repentis]KAI0588630.1 Urea active transporter [Pyrenophora tritici-repentis]KAI0588867.1 Urea active transporter [Pyrenophora tritici-repentis]
MSTTPPLSQGFGYGIVIGLGFAFSFGMILTTFVLKRYNYELQTSEMFSTAGRTVKSGLVASAVVSSWTWAATLLQSSAVAYRYGVSGPFWYASGATVQIILFATIAIELKRRAPNAHTFLEVIRARYGTVTHIVFMVFGLFTNILVTSMLLTGGSAVVTSLTGMPTAAACFLLPVGVVLYTMFGGIKATFLTDYAHTVVILVILLMFAFTAYATNEHLGSPGKVFDLLVQAAADHPVEGNAGGSYMTMRSKEGAIFFVINIVGNFGTVFCDNGYYNKAIAASPVDALPGYIIGGLSWFAIPWLAATTMGLSALALESNPVFPGYPNRMADADVTAGLVLPTAAVALMGSGGAAAVLLLVFMAVTSAMSAELIAVSSIFTYDFYQTYINPAATGRQLIYMSHTMVVGFAVAMAAWSTGLFYIGISMGYLYLLMGVIISSAVLPATLTLMWSKMNWAAATFTPPLGFACSLIAWLVTAQKESGELTVASTGANNPMLAGNVVALLSPLIFVPMLTYSFGPQNYDWVSMKAIRKGDDHDLALAANVDLERVPGEQRRAIDAEEEEQAKLLKASRIARWLTLFMAVSFLVLWPMPMYGSSYIFSKKFFTGWVVIGILWMFCSCFAVGLYPLWEGRKTSVRTFKSIYWDITGKKKPNKAMEVTEGEGTDTPPEAVSEKMKG